MHRELTADNVKHALVCYSEEVTTVGQSIQGKRGLELLHEIKRVPTGTGPYPNVTLFEAANRIMTDLVILHGIRWIFEEALLPFTMYRVEYGAEASSDYDLMADNGKDSLAGEAFNVASSFFQVKKAAMLRKLRSNDNTANFRLILANADATSASYRPRLRPGEYMVLVDVFTGRGRIWPEDCRRKLRHTRLTDSVHTDTARPRSTSH